MMDALSILVLLIIGIVVVKKRLLPRLKKDGQEKSPEKGGAASMTDCKPDFRILCFNTGDFTHMDDLAHCVEYELGQAIGELEKEGCQLANDPFPIVIGSSLLVFLYYYRKAATVSTEEVAG